MPVLGGPLAECLHSSSGELFEALLEGLPLGVGVPNVLEHGLGHVDGTAPALKPVREVESLVLGSAGVAAALRRATGQLGLRQGPLHHGPELAELLRELLGFPGHGHLLYL